MLQLKEKYLVKRTDLHAHTLYSDGTVSIEESILKRKDYAEVLGISDHYRYINRRKDMWKKYVDEIRRVKGIYKDTHEILIGTEIYFEDLMVDMEKIRFEDLDFIILEHYEWFRRYDEVVGCINELLLKFNRDVIMAHPEFSYWYDSLGDADFQRMLSYLKDNDIALEINVNSGCFFNRSEDFKELLESEKSVVVNRLRQSDSRLSVGCDAHGYEKLLFERFRRVYEYFELKQAKKC